jgi:hypothetical protein
MHLFTISTTSPLQTSNQQMLLARGSAPHAAATTVADGLADEELADVTSHNFR